jgi:hypothetical protein
VNYEHLTFGKTPWGGGDRPTNIQEGPTKKKLQYAYIPSGTKTPDLMLHLSKFKWYFDGREVTEINRTTFIAEVETAVSTQLHR